MIFIPPSKKETGQFVKPSLPFSSVASASLRQGFHDTFFNQVSENVEDVIYDEGVMLTPDQANARYSLPGLEFNEPVREGLAALKYRRKQSELARQTSMQLGSNGLFSMRGVGALAVSVVGNNLSPIDFAFNFVPIAGATRYGRAANIVSKAASRGRMSGGLGRSVAKTSFPAFHRMVAAGIDASVGNLILEVPLYFQNQDDQTRHTMGDVLLNTGLGGVFGAGLSGMGSIIRAASRKWAMASPNAKEQATKAAFNEALSDRPAQVADDVLEADYNIARARTVAALEVAQADASAKLGNLEEQIRARVETQGKLGDAPKADIESIAAEAVKRILKREPQLSKTIKRLLDRSKAGEADATANLGRFFHLEFNPKAKSAPAPFTSGDIDAKLTPKQLKALDDVAYVLPKKARKALAQVNSERLDVDAYIAREVEVGRQRLVRQSYRKALHDMKEGRIEDPARRAAQELSAERPTARPLSPADDAQARAADEAEVAAEIEELKKVIGDEANESLLAAPERVDADGIRAGINCKIKNAS